MVDFDIEMVDFDIKMVDFDIYINGEKGVKWGEIDEN
jgi:hypothetical protein